MGHILAVEEDGSPAGVDQSRHGPEQGRLPGPIGTEEGDDLTLLQVEVDAEEDLNRVVGDVHARAPQQRPLSSVESLAAQLGRGGQQPERPGRVIAHETGRRCEDGREDHPKRTKDEDAPADPVGVRDGAQTGHVEQHDDAQDQEHGGEAEGQRPDPGRRNQRLHGGEGRPEDAGREAGGQAYDKC